MPTVKMKEKKRNVLREIIVRSGILQTPWKFITVLPFHYDMKTF